MTMAVIAAMLAAISLVGHRKHNENLILIGEANRLRTEAAAEKVESSNFFAWYQAKRVRVELARTSIDYANLFAPAPNSDESRAKKIKEWEDYDAKNDPKGESVKVDKNGMPDEKDETLPALRIKGKLKEQAAEHSLKEAERVVHKAEHVHHQADWLDLAHLAVELGLVLCTICILTKKKAFWLAGITATLAGAGLALYALQFMH